MFKTFIAGLAVCFLTIAGTAWAHTYHVLDTGDPAERVCNPKSYTDLGGGIVRDNVTGLEWVQDGNLILNRNPSFDNDGTAGDGMVTWQHALDYIDLLNDDGFLGYSDWRLPSIEELSSLVDVRLDPPLIDPMFGDTVASFYWSSTTSAYGAPWAWYVHFLDGSASFIFKEESFFIRAVRGGRYEPSSDFVSNGDGTVTDMGTDLMWQQCNYGQVWDGDNCTGKEVALNWYGANDYVQSLNDSNMLGYSDWRLPTKNELQSLVDYSRYNPATAFLNTVSSEYWSSTNNASNDGVGWYSNFSHGHVDGYGKGFFFHVRAVRGGLCRANGDWCLDDSDCDDGLFCTGTKTCIAGECVGGANPCSGVTPVCDEATDRCVECLTDAHCPRGYRCEGNACIPVGTMLITRATVRAGKFRGADSIKFSGSLNATAEDITGGTVTLRIEADGIPDLDETTFIFPINAATFVKGKYKSPKVKPVNKTDQVVGLAFDTIKGKLSFTSKNLNLTGLACPITVSIQFGDYAAVTTLLEAVVNGPNKPCPPELMR